VIPDGIILWDCVKREIMPNSRYDTRDIGGKIVAMTHTSDNASIFVVCQGKILVHMMNPIASLFFP
jgi:hypothetical protein